MNYEALKREAIVQSLNGKPRFTKKEFKDLAYRLREPLGVRANDESQLWELAEPDENGEVNRSYIEEICDMIHNQREQEIDSRFDIVTGLKYVNQTVFNDETIRVVPLENIRRVVQGSFENGQGLIMQKIESIAQKGNVDRVDLAELIDTIQNNQLFGGQIDNDSKMDETFESPKREDSILRADYSEEKDRELYSLIRDKLEKAIKECERTQGALTVLYYLNRRRPQQH
jgi:hypothetical protein